MAIPKDTQAIRGSSSYSMGRPSLRLKREQNLPRCTRSAAVGPYLRAPSLRGCAAAICRAGRIDYCRSENSDIVQRISTAAHNWAVLLSVSLQRACTTPEPAPRLQRRSVRSREALVSDHQKASQRRFNYLSAPNVKGGCHAHFQTHDSRPRSRGRIHRGGTGGSGLGVTRRRNLRPRQQRHPSWPV
jgi:hypothetical protein